MRLLFLYIVFCISFLYSAAQTKHALLFAIGDYPQANGWQKLSSSKDVAYIKKALEDQKFSDNNIKIIKDSAATIEGINNAFVELVNKVKQGDIVVIHFSCHGEQVQADNNNKIDGLDECVVTYNAISPYQSTDFTKDQAAYLRGHVLGDYLHQLRSRLGKNGDVIVFMDFCHSGNGTRGAAKVRGGQPALVPQGYDLLKKHKVSDSSLLFREANYVHDDDDNLSSYEVISATRPEELDYETMDDNGVSVGSLSYAVSKAFENMEAGSTYRSFFSKIQSLMNVKVPEQHPLLEGNGIDRAIFGGAFVYQKPYIEIDEIINNSQLVIKGGLLCGLDSGAKVALYPSGTIDPLKENKITTGTIISSGNFLSTVILDSEIKFTQPSEGWVFITDKVYKIDPVSIKIISNSARSNDPGGFSSTESKKIESNLQDFSFIKFDNNPLLLITKGKEKDSIKIAANGYLFKTIKSAVNDSAELKDDLQKYAQYKYLQALQLNDPSINVDVKLVPVINGVADTNSINSKIVNGVYQFKYKDTIVLWLKNTGNTDAYINILDLQPDGIINPVLPNKRYAIYPNELNIRAGTSYLYPASKYSLTIYPPYGTEVFKVFASATEIDLENIATGKGITTRSNISALEMLVKKSYQTRGAEGNDNSNADGTTTNILFRIMPK